MACRHFCATVTYMTEKELWKDVEANPSDETLHQKYVNACVKHNLEKEAIQRYRQIQSTYPAIAAKFTKQLVTVLQFKLMPSHSDMEALKPTKNLIMRLFGFEYSILISGVLSLAYGLIAGSPSQTWLGVAIILGFMGYKYFRVKRARRG